MSDNLNDLTWTELEKAYKNTRRHINAMLTAFLEEDSPVWKKSLTMLRDDWNDGMIRQGCEHATNSTDERDPGFSPELALAAAICNSFYYSLGMATGVGDMPEQLKEAMGDELATALMNKVRKEAYSQMFS